MIGEAFKKQLTEHGIDHEKVSTFVSKYNKETDKIVTKIIMEDGTKHTIKYGTVWYASRKNKRW